MGPCWRNPLVYSILSSILRQLPKQTSEASVTATGSWQHLILLGHCPLRCGICSKFLYQFMVLFLLLQQFVGPEIKRQKWEWVPYCTFITGIHCQIFYCHMFRLCELQRKEFLHQATQFHLLRAETATLPLWTLLITESTSKESYSARSCDRSWLARENQGATTWE